MFNSILPLTADQHNRFFLLMLANSQAVLLIAATWVMWIWDVTNIASPHATAVSLGATAVLAAAAATITLVVTFVSRDRRAALTAAAKGALVGLVLAVASSAYGWAMYALYDSLPG